ncbi:MAG: DUF2206 domain-containing protein [Candidatus Bathyarchaeota archaeon]|nr:DUF2206 domain-containing protein [Candidatus Bathyarchaeota archaeon]
MSNPALNQRHKGFLLSVFFIQFIVNLTILLDIFVAKQIIGFIYLTFVPGYVFIRLLKMQTKSLTEHILFSVGLSTAFLMLLGLLVNSLYLLFDIPTPISLMSILVTINIFMFPCTMIAYLRNMNSECFNLNFPKSSILLILLCIPILSIIGAIASGAYGDNKILLLIILTIAILFTVSLFFEKIVLTKLYPMIILIIAISLIYHSQMVSDKLLSFGSDVGGEVFAQKIVEKNAYWDSANPYHGDQSVGRTYAMLSVTLLPTIYSILLNFESILVFKLFYSLFLALVPLGLYNLWKNFVGERTAFVSAFFFMSFQSFYGEILGLNKQILGEMFLVLLLTVVLREKESGIKRIVLSFLFSFALIVSHYALAEIFLFLVSFILIIAILTRKPSRKVTLTFVLCFFAMMFVWYIYMSSSSVFDAFLTFGERVYNELGDFFNINHREPEVLRGLGLELPPTIWNLISRIFAYMTEALIVVGFIYIILKRTKIYLEKEYFFLVCVSMLFLGALIVVPGLADTMNMTRFYHVLLFFIAPLCVIGSESIIIFIAKRRDVLKTSVLLIMVLIPYFLFQTGFVYELTNSPSLSLSLSKHRMSQSEVYHTFGYANEHHICAAIWLSNEVTARNITIYAEPSSRAHELKAYGGIYTRYVGTLSNVTQFKTRSVVYLNPSNVIEGTIIVGRYIWNITDFQFLNNMSKVYTSGESEVFYTHAS